ncbi:plexin-C1 [Pelobates cultripes]|uniref:Plexin-C1 n=1 Tax=Pelobates cultripes TaxID=61616 RepID=A0AAD1RT08_PELCU|nr:plexin-C1 [Pelobates cultripes]
MPHTLFSISLLVFSFFIPGPVYTKDFHSFRYSINNIAVGEQRVVVATENCLYLFDHTLHLLSAVGQRENDSTECMETDGGRTSLDQTITNYNMLLLVYNETVLSCWSRKGICNERGLDQVEKISTYSENVVYCDPQHPAVGFVQYTNPFYLFVATYAHERDCKHETVTSLKHVSLRVKDNGKLIIDLVDSFAFVKNAMHFVDGFLWENHLFFSYYLLNGGYARMAVLSKMFNRIAIEFQARVKLVCKNKEPLEVILSSTKFSISGKHFWAGIFTSRNKISAENTALCIFDLTAIKQVKNNCSDEDFTTDEDVKNMAVNHVDHTSCVDNKQLPVNERITLTHGNLSAVYAVEVNKRIVFFLGTGNGQVLKVNLDAMMTASCPEVIDVFTNETSVFRTIAPDPVNSSYIYVATTNQIKRIKVETCIRFNSCAECLSAQDPYCGWCHSEKRCTSKTECDSSASAANWVGIANNRTCLEINAVPIDNTQINITVRENTGFITKNTSWICTFEKLGLKTKLCTEQYEMACSCLLSTNTLSDKDQIIIEITSRNAIRTEIYQFERCSRLQSRCSECINSGCLWCNKDFKCRSPLNPCNNYANLTTCMDPSTPVISEYQVNISLELDRISVFGKQNMSISGQHLENVSKLVLIGTSSCNPEQVDVFPINNTHAKISFPPSHREIKGLCLNYTGSNCIKAKTIYYVSPPVCFQISPNTPWVGGGRKISIFGRNLDILDKLLIQYNEGKYLQSNCSSASCSFEAPTHTATDTKVEVKILVNNDKINCGTLLYKPNPTFKSFSVLHDVNDEVEFQIKKKNDDLYVQKNEIQVKIDYINSTYDCPVHNITQNADESTVLCKMRKPSKDKIKENKVKVTIIMGNFTKTLEIKKDRLELYWFILLVIPLLLIVILAACFITRYKSKQLSNKLSKQVELLECQIRQEIRDGFAEFQMDKLDLKIQTTRTIPFFDYKHFALKILFPELEGGKMDFSEKLFENIPSPFQSRRPTEDKETLSVLKTLFENKSFMIHLIHTLEKQSSFTIKDRCMFASFLTIAFQNNLVYLTELMEDLIRHLMDQPSNKHPKLLLRRTESVVEKLLTNWMSTCLYGFLRENVGEPLYLLVQTLNQSIHKGPIDAITCKALYTLNEDWLLWQISEFNTVELNVNFPVIHENEKGRNDSNCIKVLVLDCDTIGQTREKILQTYLDIKGYPFVNQVSDISIEYHYGQTHKTLLDIDASSVIFDNGIKKLNTIKHYKLENGATINVIKDKCNDVTDIENPQLYCHLVLSDTEENEASENGHVKGKQKFKVKELYLTKLLSTKVAIHTPVEKLFRSIWTIHGRPPVAIKYFFDFLDAQAENKKVSDPDVLHIWKTNSLPLRFWINILKNPQFVFDIKKTALLDSSLSVVAQAFMDGFSLAEHQLGKSAPTNKLLYAKDIPQFKEEIKAYYKDIRDSPAVSPAELKEFLNLESKKHEHEFKEDMPLLELYKYIEKYFDVIMNTLASEPELKDESRQLLQVKAVFEDKKKWKWE